jgi:hypothetical protein
MTFDEWYDDKIGLKQDRYTVVKEREAMKIAWNAALESLASWGPACGTYCIDEPGFDRCVLPKGHDTHRSEL